MKYNKIYTWAAAATLLLATSCEKIVPVDEKDPNRFPGSSEELMIAGPELATVMAASGEMTRIAGMYTHQFTGADRQYTSINRYITTSGDYDNAWTSLYVDGVKQARLVQDYAINSNKKDYLGRAQILEAYLIGIATSLWGDVPFSQAANKEAYPNPKFDNQLEVYTKLQTLLDSAIVNVGGETVSGPVYVATGVSWAELAYSLKARYYMHTGNYAQALAAAQNGVAQDWKSAHGENDGDINLMYSFLDYYRAGYMTADGAYLPSILDTATMNTKTIEASRFSYFYLSGGNTWYASQYDPNMSDGIFAYNQSFVLFSVAENQLIMAEAARRTSDNNSAVGYLNNARNYWDSFLGGDSYQDFVLADFQNGGMMNPNNLPEGDVLLKEILLEKYKALYGTIEAFNDMRRTHNLIGIPLKSGTQYPERFLYPQEEINSNTSTPSGKTLFTKTEVNQ